MSRIIYFNEEAHRYSDDLGNIYLSTTTLLGQYEEAFDTKGQAQRLSRLGTGIYKGKSVSQIEAMWKASTVAACEKGNKTHDELELSVKETSMFMNAVKSLRTYDEDNHGRLFTLDDVLEMDNIKPVDTKIFYDRVGYKYPIIQQTIEYYTSNGWLLFAELGIYDEQRLISGMIDLFVYKHPYFVIVDWKTNKDDIAFESYYFKRDNEGQSTDVKVIKRNDYLKYPIDDLINCKGNKYGMQLSVYASMCEQRGLIFAGGIIFHIRDQYVPNKYGKPLRDENNNYVVDEAKGKKVEVVIINHLKNQVDRVFADHLKRNHGEGIQYKITM